MKILRDASELGLKPGVWPAIIVFEGREFSHVKPLKHGGEIYARLYRPAINAHNNHDELEISLRNDRKFA